MLRVEDSIEQGNTTQSSETGAAAALAASANRVIAASAVRFPPEDGGRSLAEMAQRDLDAALQLLADRAQYITGAGGAAIALRRSGKNDMLCRASTGSNAPELGALLSTEFGISGESVRTRQPLRCDDATRDRRVNREVCRQMGIASVAVMPVVHDDEVLGVFELFSGKANAFGERDLSALRRLSEMVETAVKLARAAETLPEQLRTAAPPAEALATEIVDVALPVIEPEVEAVGGPAVEPVLEVETEVAPELQAETAAPAVVEPPQAPEPAAQQDGAESAKPEPAKKPLLWSAPVDANGETPKPVEADQSHVPPVWRNLRKCEACGFPISAGRVLCVECEEKRWRGQLRVPQATARPTSSQAKVSAPAPRAFAAAAQASAAAIPAAASPRTAAAETVAIGTTSADAPTGESAKATGPELLPAPAAESPSNPHAPETAETTAQPAAPEVTFTAGLEPSQSWFAAHKYILGALLVVAATVAVIVLLR